MPRSPSPTLKKPCASCGTPTTDTRCDECRATFNRPRERTRPKGKDAGYDAEWRKLSKRARKLQPFCLWCNSTTDLTCDHTEEAWARKAAGKKIRLRDVRVLCRSCNSSAGPARKSVQSY